jgi:hypothetical protein
MSASTGALIVLRESRTSRPMFAFREPGRRAAASGALDKGLNVDQTCAARSISFLMPINGFCDRLKARVVQTREPFCFHRNPIHLSYQIMSSFSETMHRKGRKRTNAIVGNCSFAPSPANHSSSTHRRLTREQMTNCLEFLAVHRRLIPMEIGKVVFRILLNRRTPPDFAGVIKD